MRADSECKRLSTTVNPAGVQSSGMMKEFQGALRGMKQPLALHHRAAMVLVAFAYIYLVLWALHAARALFRWALRHSRAGADSGSDCRRVCFEADPNGSAFTSTEQHRL